MHVLARWWHRWARASVRHAWGLAPLEGSWVLVGLIRQSTALVQVQSLTTWRPAVAGDMDDWGDLSGLSLP